jgi:hypothetical protein
MSVIGGGAAMRRELETLDEAAISGSDYAFEGTIWRRMLAVLDAVDALGVAIADAGYAWTPGMRAAYEKATADNVSVRPCTCHPDDNPPRPCPQKYALADCRAAADQPDAGKVLYEQQCWHGATPWDELHEDTRTLWRNKATTGQMFPATADSGTEVAR